MLTGAHHKVELVALLPLAQPQGVVWLWLLPVEPITTRPGQWSAGLRSMAKAAPSRLAGASPCWLRAVSRPIPYLSPIGNQPNLMVFAPGFVVWR